MANADSYSKDFPISWEELHRNGKALAWKLLDKGPLEGENGKALSRSPVAAWCPPVS